GRSSSPSNGARLARVRPTGGIRSRRLPRFVFLLSMSTVPSTIAEAADSLRGGRLTSVALTEALLERAHAAQASLGAFIAFTDQPALAAARQADADFKRGVDRGPLQGVPLGVKDIIATRDAPT